MTKELDRPRTGRRTDANRLFDLPPDLPKPRKQPRKLMHVIDAGPWDGNGHKTIVRMSCRRCELETGWFTMENVTAAKRGIECPKCAGKEYSVDSYGEYQVRVDGTP